MLNDKIIFANRRTCFEKPGGDTIQMLKTKEYLEKQYGLEIKICLTPSDILKDDESEIVHIFNIQTIDETLAFMDACKKKDKKIVLTPIHWDYSHAIYIKYLAFLNIYPSNNFLKFFKAPVINLFNIFILSLPFLRKKYADYLQKGLINTNSYVKKRQKALLDADIILSNSQEELQIYSKIFYIRPEIIEEKAQIIPNAVDQNLFTSNEIDNDNKNFNLPENYVLQVGRIEPAKNQINVLQSLYNLKHIPVVFVGHPIDLKYFKKLKKIAKKRGNVFFVDNISHDKLLNFYKKAGVHVLPSFAETTGLVTLEALLSGCCAVVSSKEYCPVMYYEFDKYCHLCNPYDIRSIRKAILNGFDNPKTIIVSDDYKNKISYQNTADKTYQSYLSLYKPTKKP